MESVADPAKTTHLSTAMPHPPKSQVELALRDIKDSLHIWRVWYMLAYQDLRVRYRRSVLGPFWITLSMAISVYTMGYLYSHLFHSNIRVYFPFLAAGMLAWAFISSAITELTDAFTFAEGLIKQIKLPYSLYIHRIVTRNTLIFFHNSLIMLPIFILFHETIRIDFYTLLLLPGLFLLYVNAFCYGMILAMMGARFRDVFQIIRSAVQIIFFVTPIMWDPAILPPEKRYLADLNPFYSFIELIRAPLTGRPPQLLYWMIAGGVTVIGMAISFLIFKKYRARIVYWL